MNKIYSVVWSRSLNQLVVTSELAGGGGKASRDRRKGPRTAASLSAGVVTALLAMGGTGWAPSAQAQGVWQWVAPRSPQ